MRMLWRKNQTLRLKMKGFVRISQMRNSELKNGKINRELVEKRAMI